MVECVLGLGPNLFYNSPMEACFVICRSRKSAGRKGKTLFIDAVHEIAREKTQSFLRAEHQERILRAYQSFESDPAFAHVATTDEILANDGDLTVHHYVTRKVANKGFESTQFLAQVWERFDSDGREFWTGMDALVETLESAVAEESGDA